MKGDPQKLHFDKEALPMPQSCHDALMNAARSVKEETPVKRTPLRIAAVAALVIVLTMTVALAAQQLGWLDYLLDRFDLVLPKAAEEILNVTQPLSCEVGPMTFTWRQLMTDGRTTFATAEVRMTDGTKALIANDSDLYEAVDAVSDTVMDVYGLEPGTTWVEAAAQLQLPLYGVRAIVETAHSTGALEDAMWNTDGSINYFSMSNEAENTESALPVTLYMAVHNYDPSKDEIHVNAYTARESTNLPCIPLLDEAIYSPVDNAQMAIALRQFALDSLGNRTIETRCVVPLTLKAIHAQQYATGLYLVSQFTVGEGVSPEDAVEALYNLSVLDEAGNELPTGINLSSRADVEDMPEVSLELMTTLDALPAELVLTDGSTEIRMFLSREEKP